MKRSAALAAYLFVSMTCIKTFAQSTLVLNASTSHDRLTGGQANWLSNQLRIESKAQNHEGWYFGAKETERFRLRDQEISVGTIWAPNINTHIQFELGGSTTHNILPKSYADLNSHFNLGHDWGATLGGRISEFSIGRTAVLRAGIERYFGKEYLSYTLFSGGPEGHLPSSVHRLQWVHYARNHSSLSVAFLHGQESENIGSNLFSTNQVRGWVIGAFRPLSATWGMRIEANNIQQGNLYTRSGVSVGIQHHF